METEHPVDRLVELLNLDPLDRDLFLGSPGPGKGRLFGGLVAAQSVAAAYRTVEAGDLHSLHAYFLRPGTSRGTIGAPAWTTPSGSTAPPASTIGTSSSAIAP